VLREEIIALAEGATRFEDEISLQLANGEPRFVILKLSVVPGCEETLSQVLISGLDITERKQMEHALRQYEFIVTALPDAVSFVDRDYIYRVINNEYLRRTGKSRDVLVGHSVAEVTGEEVFQNIIKPELDRCLNDEPVHYQTWFDFPTTGQRFVDVHYSPYRDEHGVVSGVVVSARDITSLKQTEEAIAESQNELKTIYDSVPVMICQLNNHRKVIEANQYFRSFTGWPDHPIALSEKACGVLGCVNSLDDPRGCGFGPNCKTCSLRLAIIDTLQTGKTHTGIEYKTKLIIKGVLKDIVLFCSTALIKKHDQDVALLSMIDITGRKQMEEALNRSLQEKEVLLREVHHRVKNNFASIIGLVELQHQGVTDPLTSALLTQLTQRLRSMALVHEMLYQSESLDQIDFHRYVQSLCHSLQDAFSPSGVIRVQAAAPGVWMSLDHAIPCGLIVNELVTNAFKYAFPDYKPYSEADYCEIQVSAHWDGKVYNVIVADNGVGLPDTLDWMNAPSLGLLLVRMLGRHQLQGRIELDRTSGAHFSLWFNGKP
jgi:PAS domain S-box-containing protein